MSAVPKPRKLTAAEYLAIERDAAFKSEFFDGEMFAMAGAGRHHNRVKDNLIVEIGSRLKGGPCWTFSSDQRVNVDRTGLYTYPDILIVCGEPQTDPLDEDTFTNPRVVIEVLSPSTERYDRGAKLRHYQTLPSLQEYVLVSQDRPRVEVLARGPNETWVQTAFDGLDSTLALAGVGVAVPLADVYAGVRFPPPEVPPTPPPADRRPGD